MSRNARVGFVLFLVYATVYAAFVLLNAFSPAIVDRTPMLGINLAILYGLGLILFAFLLAVLYGLLCARRLPSSHTGQREEP